MIKQTVLLMILFFSGVAQALPVSLVEYGTAGNTTSLAAISSDTNVNSANLTAGSGIDSQNFSTFNFSNWDPANSSAQDAIDDNEVWRFGFSALSDMTLTNLEIRLDRSGTGPDNFEVFAAVDLGVRTSLLSYDFNDSSSGVNFLSIDLSSFSLTSGQSMGFLIAAYNAESTGGTFDLETFDGVTAIRVNGDVAAVPVPAAVWLMGSAIVGLVGFKRKRTG